MKDFIEELYALLAEHGVELSGSHEGDVNVIKDGKLAGFWTGGVIPENFSQVNYGERS